MNYQAIVLGVSSGGIKALEFLFSSLPYDFKIPIIVVQHRLSDGDDFLEKFLNKKSKLNVKKAELNEKILDGFVYFAPTSCHLLIENDRTFSISVDPPVNYSQPSIDVLFESAADVYSDKLIGVILTGANNDGSFGLKKIRDYGGLGIVEDPQTAESKYMPESAIKIAGADYVLSLNSILNLLVEINNEK